VLRAIGKFRDKILEGFKHGMIPLRRVLYRGICGSVQDRGSRLG
jgi:hypothetical protein